MITNDRRHAKNDRRTNAEDRRQKNITGPWMSGGSVTAIISAYNEAERIGAVIGAAKACVDIDDVIVVDDGSMDETAEVAGEYKVSVVRVPKNVGKGGAMMAGIRATEADVLVFIDADLLGLRPRHLTELIRPMRNDETIDMTAGRFIGGRLSTNLSQKIMPSINSQRAIRRTLLDEIPDFSESRFGVETIINSYAKRNKKKVLEIPLTGVAQVLKEEKRGLAKGAAARVKMYGNIVKSSVKKPTKKS